MVRSSIKACRCECGYRCGTNGRMRCELPIMECMDKHYVRDCDHKWDGKGIDEWANDRNGKPYKAGWSSTCSICDMSAMSHDCAAGP